MKQSILILCFAMFLVGCAKDYGGRAAKGSNMHSDHPERAITNHSQNVIRNEAASAAAVSSAAVQLGIK